MKKKLLKKFCFILIVFLSSCELSKSLEERDTVGTMVAQTLSSIPTQTPLPTLRPFEKKNEFLKEVVALLENQNNVDCKKVDSKIFAFMTKNSLFKNDAELLMLREFASACATSTDRELLAFQAVNIFPPTYNGVYDEQIRKLILSYWDLSAWEYISSPEPRIGMTKDQVESSKWGNPSDINRTITADSISEQWVYGIGRYIYFKNGVVIAIQD